MPIPDITDTVIQELLQNGSIRLENPVLYLCIQSVI